MSWSRDDALKAAWTIYWTRVFPHLCVPKLHLFYHSDGCTNLDWDLELLPILMPIAYNSVFGKRHKDQPSIVPDYWVNNCIYQKQKTLDYERDKGQIQSNSLGYGEVLPESLWSMMMFVLRHQCLINKVPGNVIVDLGSGNGKVLIAASLVCEFDELLGYEIVPKLHQEALDNLLKWSFDFKNNKFVFKCDDFTKHSIKHASVVVVHATLFVVHATLFDSKLMASVKQMCLECASGTYFLMISKPLQSTEIETLAVLDNLEMDWGFGKGYIQRKI